MFFKSCFVILATIRLTEAVIEPTAPSHNLTSNASTAEETKGIGLLRADLLPICGISSYFDDFPWMVIIKYGNRTSGFDCGGFLINNRYVLTAAVCTDTGNPPKPGPSLITHVRIGEYNTNTNPDCIRSASGRRCAPPYFDVDVAEIILHENYDVYDVNYENNIALLRLKNEIEFTETLTPICLPTTPEERSRSYIGKQLSVASWGKAENGSRPSFKRKVKVPLIDREICRANFSEHNVTLSDGHFCAGGLKGSVCYGDAGYPLMAAHVDGNVNVHWYAVGLVSFGPCGEYDVPSAYTNISVYMPWIINKLKP